MASQNIGERCDRFFSGESKQSKMFGVIRTSSLDLHLPPQNRITAFLVLILLQC
jgi:hypothetical protein